jgi:hypothetical protein
MEKSHAPAKAKVAEADAAALGPPNEVAAKAEEEQVDAMAVARAGTFDKGAFIAAVRTAIEKTAPKTLEEADNLKDSDKLGQVKDQVASMVTRGKDDSAKDIKGSTEKPLDTSRAKPKEVVPMEPETAGPPPRPVGGDQAMPTPRGPEQTNLDWGPCSVKAKMADAKVTDAQLANSNEPGFNKALAAKRTLEEHAASAPGMVRTEEAKHLQTAKASALEKTVAGVTGMRGARATTAAHVGAGKDQTKAADEAKRAEVAKQVEEIFNQTKIEVSTILDGLDHMVSVAFDTGEKTARETFNVNVARDMGAWKDERYSGASGAVRWLADKVSGPPAEVNAIFARNRAAYVAEMDKVISSIAEIVAGELGRAKQRISGGRAEVTKCVDRQPAALREVAAEAEQKLSDQFDSLEGDVDAKQDSVVQDLAQRYVAARQLVDDDITKMQEKNKGLVEEAEESIEGVIDVIRSIKDMLLNVLSRAEHAIDRIIADPIGFLKKLVNAVKGGFSQFMANIGQHLKQGLQGWLFGTLAEAGITLPEKFDLKGILNLVLSVLGLTWTNIRGRIVANIGEPVMAKLEQTVDVFKTIATEGLGGLWKWVAEKVGDLRELVMGQIRAFVQEKIVVAGITWLIGLLNPAAAFIKACKAIYDVVMFFVEKGQQIKELVDSVLDSVESILSGGVGAVANLIENTLAKFLPVAISFLASILGLGGIGEKIREIIGKIQQPVKKAIDAVIGGALKIGKKLFGGLIAKGKGLYAKGKGLYAKGKTYVKGQVEAGKAWTKAKLSGKPGLVPDRRTTGGKIDALDAALAKATALLLHQGATPKAVNTKLPHLKSQYGLTELKLIKEESGDANEQRYHFEAAVNPKKTSSSISLPVSIPPTRTLSALPAFYSLGPPGMECPSELPEKAKEARAKAPDLSLDSFRSNIAVLKAKVGSGVRYFVSPNDPNRLHSESLLFRQLEEEDPHHTRTQLIALYTERVPCAQCRKDLIGIRKLRQQDFGVFYSLRTTTDRDLNAQALMGAYLRTSK